MRRLAILCACAVLVFGGIAYLDGPSAGPCDQGKGPKNGGAGCYKKCDVPPGCSILECSACGCALLCPQDPETIRSVPLREHSRPSGPGLSTRLSDGVGRAG